MGGRRAGRRRDPSFLGGAPRIRPGRPRNLHHSGRPAVYHHRGDGAPSSSFPAPTRKYSFRWGSSPIRCAGRSVVCSQGTWAIARLAAGSTRAMAQEDMDRVTREITDEEGNQQAGGAPRDARAGLRGGRPYADLDPDGCRRLRAPHRLCERGVASARPGREPAAGAGVADGDRSRTGAYRPSAAHREHGARARRRLPRRDPGVPRRPAHDPEAPETRSRL